MSDAEGRAGGVAHTSRAGCRRGGGGFLTNGSSAGKEMQQATKCRGGRYLENHGPQLQVKVLHRVTVPQQADALHVEPVNRKKQTKSKF